MIRFGTTAVLATAALSAVAASTATDLSTKGLVKTAAAYVADYEKQMAYVIADEEYTQRTFDPAGQMTRERIMNGQLLLTFVPADHEWMAVHDVAIVDGDVVPDRSDIREVLQRGEFESVARQLMARNARFNIGGVERNFNEPTLALLALEAKRLSGFSFDRKAIAKDGDRTIATVALDERDSDALIRDTRGEPVHLKGEFEMDAETGQIRRTRLEFKINSVLGELTTVYALEEKIKLWVPVTFTEHYTRKTSEDFEDIRCEAKYTNYKQYGATVRIKIK